MKLRILFVLAILIALAGLTSSISVAQNGPPVRFNFNPCPGSINSMFIRCRFEAQATYFEKLGKCYASAENNDERSACRKYAKSLRRKEESLCGEVRDAQFQMCEDFVESRYYGPEGLSDNSNFIKQPDNSNPYYSQRPGKTYVARGGDNLQKIIVTTVTNEVRQVLGVNCRITINLVLDKKDSKYIAVEITDHYYAQALNGDVYHCGQVVRNFENGALVNLDGSFEAGRDFAMSGIFIKAQPVAGDTHRRELALSDAEALIHYVAGEYSPTSVTEDEGGENPRFPCLGQCVKLEVIDPLEPGSSEYVYFKAGIGFVVGVDLEGGSPTGERSELLCTGDSLAILTEDAYCGFDKGQLPTLMNQLCKLSPIAFCNME